MALFLPKINKIKNVISLLVMMDMILDSARDIEFLSKFYINLNALS